MKRPSAAGCGSWGTRGGRRGESEQGGGSRRLRRRRGGVSHRRVEIVDGDGQRRLTTWHTNVALQPCPGCGRPFTPEPMGFVLEHVPDIDHVWGLRPACRRQATVDG